jgi:hypothetical protein
MKRICLLALLVALFSGCSVNRYLLTGDKSNEDYLMGVIKELSRDGQISKKPLVVVDLAPQILKEDIREYRLPVSKDMIGEIWTMEKQAGVGLFGTSAEGGVIVMFTKQFLEAANSKDDYNKILFLFEIHKQNDVKNILILLDGREIKKEEWDTLNLHEIKSIHLVKDPKIIEKYSDRGYSKIFLLQK